MKTFRLFATASLPILFAACSTTVPAVKVEANAPPQWQSALSVASADQRTGLPHGGSVESLSAWWQQHNDPLLVELIMAAQEASPTLSAAASRIVQARASQIIADAALLPALDGSVSATRARSQPPTPTGSALQAGLQAGWEIDLFGGNRAARTAAEERLAGAQAGWHEARVSVAAELATRYYQLRGCALLLAITRSDAASRRDGAPGRPERRSRLSGACQCCACPGQRS